MASRSQGAERRRHGRRKITLKAFADRWLKEYADPNLQPGTVRKYREGLEDKICPPLGHLKLSALKPGNINALFLSLAADGARKDGKSGGYSKGSIAKARNVLSPVLRTAVEWEIIDHNPCEKIHLHGEDVSERLKFFMPEEAVRFLNDIEEPYTVTVKGHQRVGDTGIPYTVGDYKIEKTIPEQIRVLFNPAVYTGLRKSELLALTWSDIDFGRDLLQVSKAVPSWMAYRSVKSLKQGLLTAQYPSLTFLRFACTNVAGQKLGVHPEQQQDDELQYALSGAS